MPGGYHPFLKPHTPAALLPFSGTNKEMKCYHQILYTMIESMCLSDNDKGYVRYDIREKKVILVMLTAFFSDFCFTLLPDPG